MTRIDQFAILKMKEMLKRFSSRLRFTYVFIFVEDWGFS